MIATTAVAWLAAATPTAYIPFLYPLPYAWDYWYLLLVPLCIAVAVVYKSVKCESMSQVPYEATTITLWILLGMVAAGAALAGVVALAAH